MYNRYLTEAAAEEPAQGEPVRHSAPGSQTAAALGGLTRGLSDRLQHLRLDADTVVALIIVWFLLSDDGETDWEQLILIGVLLMLGV